MVAEALGGSDRCISGHYVLNPELAFLGFLLDPLILDVAILLLGAQFLLLNSQIRTFLVSTYLRITRRLSGLRLKHKKP